MVSYRSGFFWADVDEVSLRSQKRMNQYGYTPYQFHYPLMWVDSLLDLLTLEVLSEFTGLVRVIGDLIMALFVLLVIPPFRGDQLESGKADRPDDSTECAGTGGSGDSVRREP
jgi:hypothetical protein